MEEFRERTPRLLFQAILNGLEDPSPVRHNEDRAELIETHVRGFLAHRFSGHVLNVDNEADPVQLVLKLWNQIKER